MCRTQDGKRVGPRSDQADNNSGPTWPLDRVASLRRIPSWPEQPTLTPRPHTRVQPHALLKGALLGYLQEESIHELLAFTYAPPYAKRPDQATERQHGLGVTLMIVVGFVLAPIQHEKMHIVSCVP